jgi:cytochrome c-type biogenesis protein CcmH/NrfG
VSGIDKQRRAQLEEERDFLMKSLDDLELEQESGGIDEESYAALHDDYTARLAATLRSLRDDVDVAPKAAPVSKSRARKRVVLVALVVVFAIVAGVSLAYAVGARLPGQMGSGNSQASSSTKLTAADQATLTKLKRAITKLQDQVNASPDDYNLRLQLSLLYEQNGDQFNALKQSDSAIDIDPNRPEAHANSARLLYLISGQLPSKTAQQQYVAQALAGFTKAIELDPNYADSYFFRAVLFYGALQDFARAQIDLQNYLVKDTAGRWAAKARSLLDAATKQLESPSTTTVPPTSTTKPKK